MQSHHAHDLVLPSDAVTAGQTPRDTLRGLVAGILAAHGIHTAFADDDTLAEVGLASLDMVKLMLAVENAFTLEIPQADITPETFRSVATIAQLVQRLSQAG